MKTFVIISDPNHSVGGGQDFRVHLKGCSHIERHTKHPRFEFAGSTFEASAETAEDVVNKEVKDYQSQEQDYRASDFKICDCCKK